MAIVTCGGEVAGAAWGLMQLPAAVQSHVDRVQHLLVSETSDLARLGAVAELLHRSVAGCDAASVALLVEDAALTGATTSHVALEADLVQYSCAEGPCLSAVEEGRAIRIDVLRDDDRFTHFAAGALAVGVESVWSIPLAADDLVVGSFNLYSRTPGAFAERRADDVEPLASYAAEVIVGSAFYGASVDAVEQIVEAAEEATLVELAIGRMVADGLDPAAAWQRLRAAASAVGSLVQAARQVVLDTRSGGPPEDERDCGDVVDPFG
jgi:GAF domain-containing protein